MTGALHPWFDYEATRTPKFGSRPERFYVSLRASRAVPLKGSYVAADPKRSFDDVLAVLERSNFTAMRLTPMCCTIDGPEDSIAMIRCNVTTTLATADQGGTAALDDPQGIAFVRLEAQLRTSIFAVQWTQATPAPRATTPPK